MEDMLRVGVITSTHGIKGEVKVYPTTNNKERFLELKKVFLVTKKETRELEISNVKFFKKMVILKFKGIDTINDVEKFRRAELYVDREEGSPLMEDEFYYADLIGMLCYSEDGDCLGELKDILETGANDVYVIKGSEYKEILIPATRECILDVDVENNRMLIHLLEGLIS